MTAEASLAHHARPGTPVASWVGRVIVWLGLGYLVLLLPGAIGGEASLDASQAAIYVLIGLSLHILIGYTGQISLGHQAFVGTGSLVAANVVSTGTSHAAEPVHFGLSLVAAAAAAAAAAVVLGAVALRITGLYLALVTLVFGSVAANAIFSISSLNGHEAGVTALRPASLVTDYRFYLFCLLLIVLVMYVDIQLGKSKTGRALAALQENELVAQAFAVNVMKFKLIAFALSGAFAGLAGALYTYRVQSFSDKNFSGTPGFNLALIFVVMVVVGGLGSRAGVVVASAFFGLIDVLLDLAAKHTFMAQYYSDHKQYVSGLIGALLLLQTVILNPGGLGQVVDPVARWLRGGRFSLHGHGPTSGSRAADVRA
ncbi:MAG: branched-chain amino acid transport system permease protein [Frankiaceae bacterium]|nr:branched-chain amino acid transport system permease protein [Frankiaceae bacterium]MDX6273067.1 branched-chain amino acid transport system permease protein [Frankiales bacterium]